MKEEEKNIIKRVREKRTLKSKDGITLIALVITIIILLILATVSLNVVLGEGGLIDRAQLAKDMTEQAALEERQGLNSLMSEYSNIMAEDQNPPVQKSEVEEARESGTPFQTTTTITDDLDNEVTVPGGFNIAEDSGTKVEEGIVIEDESGNQFVWIPTGEYSVTEKVDSDGKMTNALSRRTFTSSESTTVIGDAEIRNDEAFYYYGEGNSNSIAKDQIEGFKTSATTNKGFYIGRYEQGEGNVCKAGVNPYTNIERDVAKQKAEEMYSENEYVTSELISSYAWDTALNYICQTNEEGYLLATTTDENYGNIGTDTKTNTGDYSQDKYSNIHDLLGNCYEWTTEYSNTGSWDCVVRGGYYLSSNGYDHYTPHHHAAYRYNNFMSSGGCESYTSFRLQLYVNSES